MRSGDNIRLRADGRFEARYPKGRNQQGRLLYGCCYGKTRDEAAQKREQLLREGRRVREMNLLILGAGGHGQVVRELALGLGVFRKIAFLDDNPENPLAIGDCGDCADFLEEFPIAIPSIGDRETRMRWITMLTQAGFVLPTLIHPTAVVSPNASVGYATIVEARVTIGSGAVVGNGCILSSGATIDRNIILPDGAHVDCGRVVTQNMENN